MAKHGNWTIVFPDKLIIKRTQEFNVETAKGLKIEDNSFWNQDKFKDISVIQFTDDNLDNDQVEYIDSRPNGSYDSNILGDFSQFITRWDSAYLKVLQENWDNSNYVPGAKQYDTDPVTGEMIKIKESIEDKTARLGPRPTSYTSS
jgi:hypothetical protein